MDSNTLLVLVVDGGLVLFFLYALYYISQLKPISEAPVITRDEDEGPTVVKVRDYEPTYTHPTQKEQIETSAEEAIEVDHDSSDSESIVAAIKDDMTVEERIRTINIIDIEGIGPVYAEKLYELNIFTVSDLVDRGASPSGRDRIAESCDISPHLVLEWVNHADLYRVRGIGQEYSDLLEEAGVDTVPELAQRNPMNLHAKLVEVNEEKNIVRRLPPLESVQEWVNEAKTLPHKIQY